MVLPSGQGTTDQSYLNRPATAGMVKMRVLLFHGPFILNIPNIEAMIIVETG